MKSKINWDALGIVTSLACAIHCALLPLFLTSLPIFGVEIIENTAFEIGMVALAFCIGFYSLFHGWKKHHHSLVPIWIFSAGFVFLVLKLFVAEYEQWLLLPAVTCIIAAHIVNYNPAAFTIMRTLKIVTIDVFFWGNQHRETMEHSQGLSVPTPPHSHPQRLQRGIHFYPPALRLLLFARQAAPLARADFKMTTVAVTGGKLIRNHL